MKPVTKMAGSVLSIVLCLLAMTIAAPDRDQHPIFVRCLDTAMLIWIGVCIKDFVNAWVEGTK